MPDGLLDVDRITSSLRARRVARRIEYRTTVGSTNDEAWRLVEREAADGVAVVAEHQTAGRGRLGRMWQSPRGASLLVSVALIDAGATVHGPTLGLRAAVAVHDAITSCTNVEPSIKWPNDILAGGKKLAGVLVESRRRRDGVWCYVIGVGINCMQQRGHFSPELAGRATSLELQSNEPIDRTSLAIALLKALDEWLTGRCATTPAALREAWLLRSQPVGTRVHLETPASATRVTWSTWIRRPP